MTERPFRLCLKVALAFMVTLALGAFLIHLNERNHILQTQKVAMDIAAIHGHFLQERVDRPLSATYALAALLRQGKGKIDNFDELATEMLSLYGSISALQLAPNGVISRIVPIVGNEAAMGHDLLKDPKRNKEAFTAVETKKLTLAGPFTLRQGGIAVVGRLPVFLPDETGREHFWGFTTALIRIVDLLEASKLGSLSKAGYGYEISRIHPDTGQRDVFASSSQVNEPVSYVIRVPNGQWRLSIAPLDGWRSPPVTLAIEAAVVLLTSILVALLTFKVLKQPYILSREVKLRTRDLSEANRKLQTEIVERRQAEDALRESEGRFRNMADTVPVLIWMADSAMQATYFNKAWLTFTGRSMAEAINDDWTTGLHDDDAPAAVQAFRRAFTDHGSFQGEYRLRRHDGEYRWIANHANARFTPEGEFAGYIGASLDITDIKDAERALRTARDELEMRVTERTTALTAANSALKQEIEVRKRGEAALKQEHERQQTLIEKLEETQNQLLQSEKMASIGQLAAGVAHEINNPVGFVNSNLGTLQRYATDMLELLAAYERLEGSLPDDVLQEINRLKKEIDAAYLREDIGNLLTESLDGLQRVKRIVQDLKDFSHVDESERQCANLETGLESTLNVVWNELKYKAKVVKEYGNIPQVECFPSQLNQVFMNLLINAAHAIEEQGRITIRTGHDTENVWVEVEDTGKGIKPEHLDRIFEPFFTTKPVGKGTGLGLSLSYGIVQKHGGHIEVQSELGKGSIFKVVLPRHSDTC